MDKILIFLIKYMIQKIIPTKHYLYETIDLWRQSNFLIQTIVAKYTFAGGLWSWWMLMGQQILYHIVGNNFFVWNSNLQKYKIWVFKIDKYTHCSIFSINVIFSEKKGHTVKKNTYKKYFQSRLDPITIRKKIRVSPLWYLYM